ncbi:hypothetical protein T439DRAFT_359700 [Meredithblackwellia eburnea MCA 4105]
MVAINHVGLVVSSLSRSLQFWVDLVGSKILYRETAEGGLAEKLTGVRDAKVEIVMLQLPGEKGGMVELLQYLEGSEEQTITQSSSQEGRQGRWGANGKGRFHIALEVEDIEVMLRGMDGVDGWRKIGGPILVPGGGQGGYTLAGELGSELDSELQIIFVPHASTSLTIVSDDAPMDM